MLQQANIYPAHNSRVLEALQRKITSTKANDRQCVLVFDEMAIKTALSNNWKSDYIERFESVGSLGKTKCVANHALAVMIRGLASKWKQCIGYFLTSGPMSGAKLQYLTHEAIDQLSSIGLFVKCLFCDQGTNNRNFVQTLALTFVIAALDSLRTCILFHV